MKSLIAFTKKEWLIQLRNGRLMILGILFVAFGIMNPAVAKLTPWLLEAMSDSLAQGGMTITVGEITALDSWVQFFKNIPMALIAFVCLQSSIFTGEYQSGTLILSLTKGLSRHQVVIAKSSLLLTLWTVGYFLCFGVTYGYNAYYWDNSIAKHLIPSVLLWWVFGLWTIALMIFFSTLSASSAGVLLGCGGCVMLSYLLSVIPRLAPYLPTQLTDGNSLIYGLKSPEDYVSALWIALGMSAILLVLSVPILDRKRV